MLIKQCIQKTLFFLYAFWGTSVQNKRHVIDDIQNYNERPCAYNWEYLSHFEPFPNVYRHTHTPVRVMKCVQSILTPKLHDIKKYMYWK